jgi:hypothetical protein
MNKFPSSQFNRPGAIRRLLLALHVVKAPKATSCVPNWHYSNVDTTGQILTIHCVKDGKPYFVMSYIPPEHRRRPRLRV